MKTLQLELPVELVAWQRLDQGSGVSREAAKLIAQFRGEVSATTTIVN